MARYYIEVGDREIGLEVLHEDDGTVIRPVEHAELQDVQRVDFAPVHSNPETGEGLYSLLVNGHSYQVHVERADEGLRMVVWRYRIDLKVLTEREWRLQKVAPRQVQHGGAMTVKAPMPGLVKAIVVAAGDSVAKGQRLLVLEAMKMENDITSPRDGRVVEVFVTQGATVEGGKPLVALE